MKRLLVIWPMTLWQPLNFDTSQNVQSPSKLVHPPRSSQSPTESDQPADTIG